MGRECRRGGQAGGTADQIVRNAAVPVLVVKPELDRMVAPMSLIPIEFKANDTLGLKEAFIEYYVEKPKYSVIECQERGLTTVAVFSDADRTALHVRYADEAYRIGPPPARESYLNAPAIIAAALRSGAEALPSSDSFLATSAKR